VRAVAGPLALVTSPPRRRSWLGAGVARQRQGSRDSPRRLVGLVWVAAWALLVSAEITGVSAHLHHDAVARASGDQWTATGLFLGGWVAMVAAMMLPATVPLVDRAPAPPSVPGRRVVGAFLAGFALPWTRAGAVLLSFDMSVHRAMDTVPALAARPWLVAAALLGVAGTAQLAPSTRRHLAATAPSRPLAQKPQKAFVEGANHGVRCVRADGPLMLVMFAAGAGLALMAALTVVMAIERSSRVGRHAVAAAGALLVCAAPIAALHPGWLPGALAGGG
jgi:predicted metal-binding membrane protein